MGGLPLLPQRGTSSIPSFNHLSFHLFDNRITQSASHVLGTGWGLGCGCDPDLLPPSEAFWVGGVAALMDSCLSQVLWREKPKVL